jgi:hypothetical protein
MSYRELFEATIRGPWETTGLDIQYRVVKNGKHAWLYLQQTAGKSDWNLNFNFWVEPYKDMPAPWKAHRGFVKAWKSARDEIFQAVGNPDTLSISGYSHGGALAILAHEDFTFHGFSVDTHAYGAPRVVWMPSPAIKERFEGLGRITARGDIVATVPPALIGYRHVGSCVRFGTWQPPNPWAHMSKHYMGVL